MPSGDQRPGGRLTRPGPRLTLIVARARNGVIGRDGAMPWHIPEELAHFRRTTLDHAVIVGRRTFESIGRPLPRRRMIVLTRDARWQADGCERAGDLDEALAIAGRPSPGAPGWRTDEVFVAGGAQIYALAMPRADRLLITQVCLEPEGDTRFPAPDPLRWRCVDRQRRTSTDGTGFEIQDWRREASGSD